VSASSRQLSGDLSFDMVVPELEIVEDPSMPQPLRIVEFNPEPVECPGPLSHNQQVIEVPDQEGDGEFPKCSVKILMGRGERWLCERHAMLPPGWNR